MSKELPFIRFWIADYMRDTKELTYEEHGVYMHILWHMWEEGGWLADDNKKLALRLGLPVKKWLALRAVLNRFLTVYGPEGDRRLTQKRLQIEYNKAIEHAKKRSAIGVKAANAKHGKAKILRDAYIMQPASTTSRVPVHKEGNIPSSLQLAESLKRLNETPAMKRALAKGSSAA